MSVKYNHWERSFHSINSALVCVICLISLAGCPETPEVATDYSRIFFAPRFTIKNESSRKQDVELTSVVIDGNGITLNKEWTRSASIDPEQETELETTVSCPVHEKNRISFLLAIDGKNYAGWAVDTVDCDIDIVEYWFGYVLTDPDGNFPPLLSSKLEPEIIEEGERENIAFYTVTITDGGLIFTLDKQIDGLSPSF
jgi:hypothetical protein